MSDAQSFLGTIIEPAAAFLADVTGIAVTAESDILTLTIAMQESGLVARVQANQGPAHSFWQFETEGVAGVLDHPKAGPRLKAVCARLGRLPEDYRIWNAIVYDDKLAYACARLLLWSDPAPLPAFGDEAGALAYYARNWRPQWYGLGEAEPGRWAANYAAAMAAVTANNEGKLVS
jgi:hypothetical protein